MEKASVIDYAVLGGGIVLAIVLAVLPTALVYALAPQLELPLAVAAVAIACALGFTIRIAIGKELPYVAYLLVLATIGCLLMAAGALTVHGWGTVGVALVFAAGVFLHTIRRHFSGA